MERAAKGTLIIIGGHEAKTGDAAILAEVAQRVGKAGRLVLVTVASEKPEELAETYRQAFGECGVKNIKVLDIRERAEAADPEASAVLDEAAVIFFTGGDQLRITSQIGDSPVFRRMHEFYRRGGTIAGTSAGAAAMPATMLISGSDDSTLEISALGMAPGLGLLDNAVVDSHFAERGRMSRLLSAVAQNPRNLGLGIDEDTAVVVERGVHLRVIGSGAVYVVDGSTMGYSSLSERRAAGIITIHGVTLHVLGNGDAFDLVERRPILPARQG